MDIMIKPEMELLSVLEFLGVCFPKFIISLFDLKYKEEIKRYFSRYHEHKCVSFYKQTSIQGFSFDASVRTCLHLSFLPDIKVEIPFDDYLIKKAGREDKLFILVKAISNFAMDRKFKDFLHLHKNFYSSLVETLKEELKETCIVETLEEDFGYSQTRYSIIRVTLFCGFFGPSIENDGREINVLASIESIGIDNDRNPIFARDRIEILCLHDFSQSFLNPITAKFTDRLKRYNYIIFNPIFKDIKARENLLEEETKRGFIYIKYIHEKLNKYEGMRERYTIFEDFYLQLIDFCENLYRTNKPLESKKGCTT